MLLTEEEAKKLTEKVISYSKADSVQVTISGNETNNIRFAVNTVSTCGASNAIDINITSNFGKKSGSATVTSVEDDSIKKGVEESETIAKLSPDKREFMPPLEKQPRYLTVKEYYDETANLTPKQRAEKIAYVLRECRSQNLNSAGYFQDTQEFFSTGNSNGLFAYHKSTSANYSVTVRTPDGTGSSRYEKTFADISRLDTRELSERTIRKSLLSRNPVELPPGRYTAILEPAAVADMVNNLSWYMDRRDADEGRSFFSDKDKGNKLGQKIADAKVNIYSDPQNDIAPSSPFSWDGFPANRTEWIKDGVLKNLFTGRFWAKEKNTEVVPYPQNIIMEGGTKSLEDLIAETDKGILVTRFWYMRAVDPQQILITGLTRDGIFLIEDGKIKNAIKNYRFNESPIDVLSNIIDMSVSEKAVGSETGDGKIVVPALKVADFNFSTISDAV